MENLAFLRAMHRGRYSEGSEHGLDTSTYCIFYAPIEASIEGEHITGDAERLLLELSYGEDETLGEFRIRQHDTNVIIEESSLGRFRQFLEDKQVKYIGQLIMYALQFKTRDISVLIENCGERMRLMEDSLDNCIDNSGTYDILDFRRKYTGYGASIIDVKEIIARINKGYYPMQMQNSYVLQGEVELEFNFLEKRYDLLKNTLIKDLDTYTSIINNNINRSARLLSIISLVGVVLNFLFGSLLAVNPILGIIGGVIIGGLSVGATLYYRVGKRHTLQVEVGRRRLHEIPFSGRTAPKDILDKVEK